jgi:hypothetical protein
MIIKLPDGSQVDLIVGSKVLLLKAVFGDDIGIGPFEVVSFEGEMPNLLLVAPDKIAPISIELIDSVSNPVKPKVEVKFTDGTVVLVDADLAPLLEMMIQNNQDLMKKMEEILSGGELKDMQVKLDAMTVERDAAVALAEKLRGSLPAIEAASSALSEITLVLKG